MTTDFTDDADLAPQKNAERAKNGRCLHLRHDTRLAWPLLSALLIFLTVLTFPLPPKEIGVDGDVTLSAILNYAHQHGLQFGRDVVSTYGPLGFLTCYYFVPYHAWLRMLTDIVLCTIVSRGLCLLAWRMRPFWRWLMLALFIFAAANLQPRIDLVFNVGVLCWALLCFAESGRRLLLSAIALVALAVFGALTKYSFLVVGSVGVALIAADLALRGQWRSALGMPGCGLALFALGWVAAGQNLGNLGAYLGNALVVIHGYNEALAWEGLPNVRQPGFLLAALFLALLAFRAFSAFEPSERRLPWRRGFFFAWTTFLAFTAWKHGFVREDFLHPAFFLAFAPVLALSLKSVPARDRRQPAALGGEGQGSPARSPALSVVTISNALALLCSSVALFSLQHLFLAPPAISLTQPFRNLARNAHWLIKPTDYLRAMNQATDACRLEGQLPNLRKLIGSSSTACFGQYAVYVLFNDLNYRPPPLLQSYQACTGPLMALNEQFYLSPAAPEYVLFSLSPVDRKFAALEDAPVLRDLLFNYQPIAAEAQFLLLKRKAADAPRLKLLREGTVRPNEPIDLAAYRQSDLWLEINLESSLLGKLWQLAYRAPTVRLAAWREPGKGLLYRHRAPAAAMNAGFLASPLLVRNDDVLDLYTGTQITRPGAYSVDLGQGNGWLWRTPIRYRIYQIENRLGR